MGSLVPRPGRPTNGFTRLATAAVVVQTLTAINPRYPAADPAAREQMAKIRAVLVAELGLSQPA
ncbi:MAG TPA: hypothetical protein VLW50_21685 [Streptosporangiaceae bacterium]|nr:hypothetical protein [Streptosporangiaceae bacterium]